MFSQFKLLTFCKLILLIVAIFVFSAQVGATAILDANFGNGGKVVTALSNDGFLVNSVAIQPDGKIVVAGGIYRPETLGDIFLVRYNANGSLDTTFGNGGIVLTTIGNNYDDASALALTPNGKIIVAGNTGQSPNYNFFLVQYNNDGSIDSLFGNNGIVIVDQNGRSSFHSVAVQPDGRIIAAGKTINDNRGAIMRFNRNGAIDAEFGNNGRVFLQIDSLELLSSITLLPNGRILVGGSTFLRTEPVSYKGNILALLESSGALVRNFGNQGIASKILETSEMFLYPAKMKVIVMSNGKILTFGKMMALFSSDGIVDDSFRGRDDLYNLTLLPDERIVAISPDVGGRMILYDKSFRFIGSGKISNLREIAVQPDGKIVAVSKEIRNLIVTKVALINSFATRVFDYDENEKADIAVYRPSNRTIYHLRGNNTFSGIRLEGDVTRIIPEARIYGIIPFWATWMYWSAESAAGSKGYFRGTDGTYQASAQWGLAGDIPVGGDYDGDGATDATVFRPSDGNWYIYQSSYQRSGSQLLVIRWGQNGDKPVPADYDYDGITDAAIYRPSEGTWYVRRSSDDNLMAVHWGNQSDIPLTGDFDGDGRADFVVYRPSEGTWYLLQTTAGFRAQKFGLENDYPVPGDYDGDGRHDIAVFRQGNWSISGSTRGFYGVQWGAANDVPIAVRYAY